MSATPVNRKVSALLYLAGGKSNRAAAEAAEVSPGTVAAWKRDPVFAAELAAVKAVHEQSPRDARALLARLDRAEQRLSAGGPVVAGGGGFRVAVSIPPGASPRKAEQLTARAIARGLRAVRRAES
ncbi:hypothetical protein E2C11_11050 [Streptomyces lavendulae]|nr:hypothetical protein [Streptomyces lavendulae]TXJ80677.1 hypothetical protein E2C11_11050 [Streptomyces lavendulae]